MCKVAACLGVATPRTSTWVCCYSNVLRCVTHDYAVFLFYFFEWLGRIARFQEGCGASAEYTWKSGHKYGCARGRRISTKTNRIGEKV